MNPLGQLGRNQLVRDVEAFMRQLFATKRRAAAALALEKNRRQTLETELELRLDDTASIMGLPPTDPMVLAAVVYSIRLGRARWERQVENAEEDQVSFLNGEDNLDF